MDFCISSTLTSHWIQDATWEKACLGNWIPFSWGKFGKWNHSSKASTFTNPHCPHKNTVRKFTVTSEILFSVQF